MGNCCFAAQFWLIILSPFVICLNTERGKGNETYVQSGSNITSENEINQPIKVMTDSKLSLSSRSELDRLDEIVVAIVVCADRGEEALMMMKSALMFSRTYIKFIILLDHNVLHMINDELKEWMAVLPNRFTFEIHRTKFPKKYNKEWKKMFAPCSTERLFLPSMLPSVDALLYIDADSLVLSPLEELWGFFGKMNSTQILGMTNENEDPKTGWYFEIAKIPYYGPSGLNAGVLEMNLTRMREINFEKYIIEIYEKYKKNIIFADQDILNIFSHFNPDKLYCFPCRYNFRSDHCTNTSICESALEEGIALIHGSRRLFHFGSNEEFQLIYRAVQEYQLGTDPYANFLCTMKKYLAKVPHSSCGINYQKFFTKAAENFLKESHSAAERRC